MMGAGPAIPGGASPPPPPPPPPGVTPDDLGESLVYVLDVPGAYAEGGLWQDSAKTTPAIADGDPVVVHTDPWTGLDLVFSEIAPPILRDRGGMGWVLNFDGLSAFGIANTDEIDWTAGNLVIARVFPITLEGGYRIVMAVRSSSGLGCQMYASDPSSGRWFVYSPSTPGSLALGSVLSTLEWCTLTLSQVVAEGDGVMRLNGTPDGVYPDTIGAGGFPDGISLASLPWGENYFDGDMRRVVIANLGAPSLLAGLEAWTEASE